MRALDVISRVVVALVVGLLSAVAHAADPEQSAMARIKEKGVLDVAVYANFPPYSYVEGGIMKGVDVDVAKAVAERLGVGVAVRGVGADESLEDDLRNNIWKGHYLGGGVADLMLRVPHDAGIAQRNSRIRLVAPYHRDQIAVVLHPRVADELDALSVFEKEKVGVELDTLADFYLLSARAGAIRNNVVHFRSVGEACAALMRGELGGVMAPRAEIEAALVEQREAYRIGAVQLPGLLQSAWDVGGAVKAAAGDLALALDQALDDMRQSGELERIFQRHRLTFQAPAQIKLSQQK
ncbi:MAG: substrate-binding periplasmic protein [Thiotrichales bacterium]